MTSSNPHAPDHIPDRPPPELPNEIFLQIIQRCPRPTLKNVRLTSKNLAQMAEPYLWSQVVIVPNESCVLGFSEGLKHSKVTRHVTKLVYDARFGGFSTHLKSYPPDPGLIGVDEDKAQIEAVLDRVSQGRFNAYDDMSFEVVMLSKVLRLLPNLQEIRVRDYDEASNATITKVPQFYRKLCRLSKVDPDTVDFAKMNGGSGRSYTKGIMTAVFSTDLHIQSFKSKNLDARCFFGQGNASMKSSGANQQLRIFQAVVRHLRVLDLSFRNGTLMSTASHIECLQIILKSCRKLKELTLSLTDYTTTRYQYPDDELTSELSILLESSTGSWMAQPLLPRLESLKIDACICHSEDLIHFLKIHATTLRKLEMSDITLLGGDDRRECWVSLIKYFKTHLNLSHVSFNGWLTNGGRQHWFVAKDNICEDRLKAKVEKYITDKRISVCPLEPLAIQVNQSDVVKPANGKEWEGDITWTMVYSSRFGGDPMDWQLTVPVFGAPSTGDSDPSTADEDDIHSVSSELSPETWNEDASGPLPSTEIDMAELLGKVIPKVKNGVPLADAFAEIGVKWHPHLAAAVSKYLKKKQSFDAWDGWAPSPPTNTMNNDHFNLSFDILDPGPAEVVSVVDAALEFDTNEPPGAASMFKYLKKKKKKSSYTYAQSLPPSGPPAAPATAWSFPLVEPPKFVPVESQQPKFPPII
ncbi:hypothetical protein LTR84_008889 [Exophiala bonariae]|uniref:F-box domain-containing protein n=1 Tax=Exophiala bonariae TaxID=1690606 RepID=A0AAV9MZ31_9EURO|nr:hypothetical protein LTR84_008889 [Exophiala bonariae]